MISSFVNMVHSVVRLNFLLQMQHENLGPFSLVLQVAQSSRIFVVHFLRGNLIIEGIVGIDWGIVRKDNDRLY